MEEDSGGTRQATRQALASGEESLLCALGLDDLALLELLARPLGRAHALAPRVGLCVGALAGGGPDARPLALVVAGPREQRAAGVGLGRPGVCGQERRRQQAAGLVLVGARDRVAGGRGAQVSDRVPLLGGRRGQRPGRTPRRTTRSGRSSCCPRPRRPACPRRRRQSRPGPRPSAAGRCLCQQQQQERGGGSARAKGADELTSAARTIAAGGQGLARLGLELEARELDLVRRRREREGRRERRREREEEGRAGDEHLWEGPGGSGGKGAGGGQAGGGRSRACGRRPSGSRSELSGMRAGRMALTMGGGDQEPARSWMLGVGRAGGLRARGTGEGGGRGGCWEDGSRR